MTFSYENMEFGKLVIHDIIQNGRNIAVTESNKKEYVQKMCHVKMTKAIETQIKAYLEGFHEVIPAHLIAIFDSRELELMVSGMPDIDRI